MERLSATELRTVYTTNTNPQPKGKTMKNKNLEQQLRELAKKFSKESGSDNDAFRLMKKILQDELGY